MMPSSVTMSVTRSEGIASYITLSKPAGQAHLQQAQAQCQRWLPTTIEQAIIGATLVILGPALLIPASL